MKSKRSRLDRFISVEMGINKKDVRQLLAQSRVRVDGLVATDVQQFVDEFTHVTFDNQILQAKTPRYIMLNKPSGVVSATKDEKHKTVIDLLPLESLQKSDLHIPGRLDFNTTGLLLLTNDGRWSRQLSLPETKIEKVYQVTLENPITPDYIDAFAEGMYFDYENITTQPAKLEIVSEHIAEVTLVEGKYHQIKRMFGRFRNRVIALHRTAVGKIELDPALESSESRPLTQIEVESIGKRSSLL